MSSLGSERAEVLSYVSFLQINIYKPLMGIARYVSFINIFSTSCSLPSAIDDGSERSALCVVLSSGFSSYVVSAKVFPGCQ